MTNAVERFVWAPEDITLDDVTKGDKPAHVSHGNQYKPGTSWPSPEKISEAFHLYKTQGQSHAKTAEMLGITHKQASTLISNLKVKEKNAAAKIAAKAQEKAHAAPKVDVQPAPAAVQHAAAQVKSPVFSTHAEAVAYAASQQQKPAAPKPAPSKAPKAPKTSSKFSDASPSNDMKMETASDKAAQHGYTIKQKPDGINKGKYAYYDKDGVQVSAPFDHNPKSPNKAAMDKAAESMHFGKGPQPNTGQMSPAEKQAQKIKEADAHTKQLAGHAAPYYEHHGAEDASKKTWPIGDATVRKMGANYEKMISTRSAKWRADLDTLQRDAVEMYTGSHYREMSKAVRDGDLSSGEGTRARRLQHALKTAPTAPPPELVWRGLKGDAAKAYAELNFTPGKVLVMKGFQSTSVSPGKASDWGTHVLLEIKPHKGAYVDPISSNKGEKEYILSHGARYTVVGVKKIKMESYNGVTKERLVYQLEQHPH